MPRNPKLSEKDLEDAFEKFLKESMSDDSMDSARMSKLFQKAKEGKSSTSPWWMDENEDNASQKREKTTSSSSWMKPKKQSTPLRNVQEEEETSPAREDQRQDQGRGGATEQLMRKYSHKIKPPIDLDDTGESLEDQTPVSAGPGLETLEEMADKEFFFKQLEEKHGSGDIDFSALNKDGTVSGTMGTLPPPYMGTADEQLNLPVSKENFPDMKGISGTGSEELTSPSKISSKDKKPSMLSQVALMDTGDSTSNFTRKPEETPPSATTGETGDSGTMDLSGFDPHGGENVGTGTASDMEALHAAMRVAADTPSLPLGSTQNLEETESKGGRTVEDIIKEVTEERIRKEAAKQLEEEEISRRVSRGKEEESRDKSRREKRFSMSPEIRGFNLAPAFQSLQEDAEQNDEDDGRHTERNRDKFGLEDGGNGVGNLGDKYGGDGQLGSGDQYGSGDHYLSGDQNYRDSTQFRDSIDDGGRVNLKDSFVAGDTNLKYDRKLGKQSSMEGSVDDRGFSLQPAVDTGQRGFDLMHSAVDDSESRQFSLQPAVLLLSADDERSKESSAPKPNQRGVKKTEPARKKSKYSKVKSSGYGPKRTTDSGDVWSPADKLMPKKKGPAKPNVQFQTQDLTHRNLLKSVESFASYIHENYADSRKLTPPPELKYSIDEPQLSGSLRESRVNLLSRERALIAEVNEWQNQWKEERRFNAKLKAEIASLQKEKMQKEEELRLQHERELYKAQQDNFVLMAKLNSHDDQSAAKTKLKIPSSGGDDMSAEERLALMQKEVTQQETLLQGYQQENERLYKEVKRLQVNRKETETQLSEENQKLHTQVANLREAMGTKDLALRNKGIITGPDAQQKIAAGIHTSVLGAGKIAELESEIKESEIDHIQLKHQIRILEKSKQELEQHIDQLVRDRNHAEEKVQNMREVKQKEFQVIQEQHQREFENLQKKLKWYAENQELLDKDSGALKAKDEEIQRLTEALEKANKQMGSKSSEAQRRAKERAADAKKIQDLERQIKEMNDIIRRRHPNSLPALMYAAAAIPDQQNHDTVPQVPGSPVKSHTVTFLEQRVKKLEDELDGKDEEVKRSLRVIQQRYNAMKIQYEDRIKDLQTTKSVRPHTTVTSLEKELQVGKERHKKEMQIVKEENERLLNQLKKAEQHKPIERNEKPIKEMEKRFKIVSEELEERNNEIEMLRSACERLMQERLETRVDDKPTRDKPSKNKKDGKTNAVLQEDSHLQVLDKLYEPKNFAGSHISDVLIENEKLKQQMESLQLEMEQQRIRVRAVVAESEAATRKAKEDSAEELQKMLTNHNTELEKLHAERALSQADSQAGRLRGQVESQKVMIQHLQRQMSEARVETDHLAAARVREQVLKTQVDQLRGDLEEAKKSYTPEMRHFEALQAKIIAMETRHVNRGDDLQRLIARAAHSATVEKDKEIFHLQELVKEKAMEIQSFRSELESILEILRELQNQGVVLPLHGHAVCSLFR